MSNINSSSYLSDLPHSILLLVLQHLDAKSLCCLEQVNWSFRMLLKAPNDKKETQTDAKTETTLHRPFCINNNSDIPTNIPSILWQPLFHQRFTMHSPKTRAKLNQLLTTEASVDFKTIYRVRHQAEASLLEGLFKLDETTHQTGLLFVTSHLVNVGNDLADLLWRCWTIRPPVSQRQKLQTQQQTQQQVYLPFPASQQNPSIFTRNITLGNILTLYSEQDDDEADHQNETEEDPDTQQITILQKYAKSFLRLVHCASTLHELMNLLRQRRLREEEDEDALESNNSSNNNSNGEDSLEEETSARTNQDNHENDHGEQNDNTDNNPESNDENQDTELTPLDALQARDDRDAIDLENALILISKVFSKLNEHTVADTTTPTIRHALDDLAQQVKRQRQRSAPRDYNDDDDANYNVMQTVEALHYVLFETKEDTTSNDHRQPTNTTPFTGNATDYYNPRNSLLHEVLASRTGLPMTLAIIYKLVAHRVGLKAGMIGLPGHMVIHVPAINKFVDVFAQGQTLTAQECEALVVERFFGMGSRVNMAEYLSPLLPEHVLVRVFNNLENAFHRDSSNTTTDRHRIMVAAMRAILHQPNQSRLEECRHVISLTWVSEHVANRGEAWTEW